MDLKAPMIIMCSSIALLTHAQKLPNIQGNSLRAPENIKIDGSPKEWGDKFQAYNHATDIFYTMANDDDNLYLVVQTNDPIIISRIMGRGITLSLQKGNIKDDKNKISITYPITKTTLYFGLQKRKGANEDTSIGAEDSLIKRHNKLIDDSCKLIQVNGIPAVDTLISVYNRNGIKAKAQFDNKKVFTCEFSVKLKFLNFFINNSSEFTYHISVNGPKPIKGAGVLVNGSVDEKATAELNDFIARRSAPTDFWGEYTLAKK